MGHASEAVKYASGTQYDHPQTLRIPLESRGRQSRKRELLNRICVAPPPEYSSSQIPLSPKTLSLDVACLPSFAPDHALSPFPKSARDRPLVRVDDRNFLPASRGRKVGAKKSSAIRWKTIHGTQAKRSCRHRCWRTATVKHLRAKWE